MPLIYISLEGVEKLLLNINLHKATGTDEIAAKMLYNFGVEYWGRIFNNHPAVVPYDWRATAIVKQLY